MSAEVGTADRVWRAVSLVALVVLSVLAASVFFALTERINRSDAALYYQVGLNLSLGNGFSSATQPPHNWVGTREPLYPLVLALAFRLLGPSLVTVFLLQVLLHVLTVLIVYHLASDLRPSAAFAWMVAAVAAVFPTLANYTVYALRETLFTFLVTLGAWLTTRAWRGGRAPHFAMAGFAWGAAILCRGVVLPLPLVVAVLAVVARPRGGFRRVALRHALVLLAATASVMGMWTIYTVRRGVEATATPRVWQNVYVRASKVLLTPAELRMYTVYSVSESIADRLYPGNLLRSVGEGYFYRGFGEKVAGLRRSGLSDGEIADLLRREALELIAIYPVKYALTGVLEFVKFNSYFQVPLLNERPVEDRFGGSVILPVLRGVFKLSGFGLLVPVALGLGIVWRAGGGVVVAVAVYFNVVHLGLDSIGRYAMPVIPLYLVLGLSVLWERVAGRVTLPVVPSRWTGSPSRAEQVGGEAGAVVEDSPWRPEGRR